jgi:hypothetical protein
MTTTATIIPAGTDTETKKPRPRGLGRGSSDAGDFPRYFLVSPPHCRHPPSGSASPGQVVILK